MKNAVCVECGRAILISKYASPKTAKCTEHGGKGVLLVQEGMKAKREAKLAGARPFTPPPKALRQSMINLYLQCPRKFYDVYENGRQEDSLFTRIGTAVHGVMEDYFNDPDNANVDELFDRWWTQHAVPDWTWYRDWKELVTGYLKRLKERPNVIATELDFYVEIDGVPCSGTIDRIDRIDDRTIRIVDYKTNARPYSDQELKESIQCSFYSLVVRYLKDKLGDFDRVIWSYEMLRLGITQNIERTPEELKAFKSWIKVVWDKMLSGIDRNPKINSYCFTCHLRSSCDAYRQVLESDLPTVLTDKVTPEKLFEERENLTRSIKLLENRLREVDEQIRTLIAEAQGPVPINDEYEFALRSQPVYTYPTQEVVRLLTLHGLADKIPSVVSVKNTELKKVVSGNKELEKALDSIKQTSYRNPSITVVRRKKDA